MANDLTRQLESLRRTVDAEHFDLTVRELVRMLEDGALTRAPGDPRTLHWDATQQSRFLESLWLGLWIPGICVAANPDGTWQVIDGVQRLWTLAHFAATRPGVLREIGRDAPLTLTGLDRLTEFNGRTLADLPPPIQLQLSRRALRVTALSDRGPPGDRTTPSVRNARLSATRAAVGVLLDVARREADAAAALEASTPADRHELAAIRKAGAYLYAAAALERACREGLLAVIAEINAHGVAPDRLRVSLFALHCAAELDAIGGGPRSLERVVRAAAMFETVFGAAHAPLGTVLPLDGRTPRAAHFATIWRVLGFPGPALPDPACALALDDLAEGRNDVAHGVRDAIAFGRSRAIADVARLVGRVDQMIAHLFETADAYLDQRLFLR